MGTFAAFEGAEKEVGSDWKLKDYEKIQLIWEDWTDNLEYDFLCILCFTIDKLFD